MISSEDLFKEETTVEVISNLLILKKGIEKNAKLSSAISTILGNWTKEEDIAFIWRGQRWRDGIE